MPTILRMKNDHAFVLIIFLLAGVQACEPDAINPNDEVTVPSITSLFDNEWILIDYKNDWLPVKLRNKVSLKFNSSPGEVHLATGKSFVNGYSGNFKLDENQKLITPVDNIISTLWAVPLRKSLLRLRILKT
jgi:hypothetical protein